MLTITFVLPSGVKVKAKLKKQELQKIVEEAKLYHYPVIRRTWKQKVKLFWVRKVGVYWIRSKEWFKKKYKKLKS